MASGRNLSEVLNEVLAKVRIGGRAVTPRSVRGTIQLPESDPDLEAGKEKVRELFDRSLARTLKQLDASSKEPEPEAPKAEQPPDVSPLEARINQLYDEIRDLVARSAENPGLETKIERKREKLRALQAEEATAWRQRAGARRHLKLGEGYRLLERAARLLGS